MASLATFPSQFATRYVDLRATICEEFVAVHVGTGINADSQVPITNYLCVLHASVPSMAMGASFTKVQDGLNFHISAECSTKVHAPYMGIVPLPPLISTRVQPTADNTPAFYPIDILSSVSRAREIELERMTLICPVHIHTPGATLARFMEPIPAKKLMLWIYAAFWRLLRESHWIFMEPIFDCLNRWKLGLRPLSYSAIDNGGCLLKIGRYLRRDNLSPEVQSGKIYYWGILRFGEWKSGWLADTASYTLLRFPDPSPCIFILPCHEQFYSVQYFAILWRVTEPKGGDFSKASLLFKFCSALLLPPYTSYGWFVDLAMNQLSISWVFAWDRSKFDRQEDVFIRKVA